jgi:diguanylate cyclase (GGDEF)-like protein
MRGFWRAKPASRLIWLRNALAQAERHTRRLAVMFIDLNGFKAVNDTHGHDVGDKVLKGVGSRLQAIVRAGDTVSRRSGDEFLLLMFGDER